MAAHAPLLPHLSAVATPSSTSSDALRPPRPPSPVRRPRPPTPSPISLRTCPRRPFAPILCAVVRRPRPGALGPRHRAPLLSTENTLPPFGRLSAAPSPHRSAVVVLAVRSDSVAVELQITPPPTSSAQEVHAVLADSTGPSGAVNDSTVLQMALRTALGKEELTVQVRLARCRRDRWTGRLWRCVRCGVPGQTPALWRSPHRGVYQQQWRRSLWQRAVAHIQRVW